MSRHLVGFGTLLGLCVAAYACGGNTNVGGNLVGDGGATDDGSSSTTDDGGAGNDGGSTTTDPNDPLNAAAKCTSNRTWTGGTRGSSSMQPGAACIACHSSSAGAPTFAIAGTVYPSGHEPDQCNGVAGAVVVITDANGKVSNLTTNAAGNFYLRGTVATPYTAKVTYQGKERAMSASQTNGDCNSCHTATGASGAPGRITLPF